MKIKIAKTAPVRTKVKVSETNLRKAGVRLLATKLVSTEISYLQRTLGTSATQEDMDTQIVAVRRLPWASIVGPE